MLIFHFIPGAINPADILSKHWGYSQVWHRLRTLLFWHGDTADILDEDDITSNKRGVTKSKKGTNLVQYPQEISDDSVVVTASSQLTFNGHNSYSTVGIQEPNPRSNQEPNPEHPFGHGHVGPSNYL
jgi:hypothetical protein